MSSTFSGPQIKPDINSTPYNQYIRNPATPQNNMKKSRIEEFLTCGNIIGGPRQEEG